MGLDRRDALKGALVATAALGLGMVPSAHAAITQKELQAMTPETALKRLKEGNERFKFGKMKHKDFAAEVKQTSGAQYPYAVVLGCMDSRAPIEVLFDQGIGDLFGIRVAGNIVNTDILGSMEYACNVVGSKLIVVLGHTECGAVKGAIDNVIMGNLTPTLGAIMPAVNNIKDVKLRSSKNTKFVQDVTEENVRIGVNEITTRSTILRELKDKRKISIIGAIYDVSTKKVRFI